MKTKKIFLLALLIASIAVFLGSNATTQAQQPTSVTWITGSVDNKQAQPVVGATVTLVDSENDVVLARGTTQKDGRYSLQIPEEVPDTLQVHISRPHFEESSLNLSTGIVDSLRLGKTLVLPDVVLNRRLSPAFWITTLIFIAVLVMIATGILHNTLAALVGAALIFLISYLGHPISEGLYIFDFATALNYIDWNVIFLIMGMMIVIAVIENTGIFQWLAFLSW